MERRRQQRSGPLGEALIPPYDAYDGAPAQRTLDHPHAGSGGGGSGVGAAEAEGGGGGGQPRMPTWWLFFIGTFWFPQFLGFVLVPNILLPVQVARLVGPNGEGAALGVVNMLIQLSGFTQPFIGAWSDRCGSSWGKRRPFIFW